ncbi:MAG: hypothetical protein ACI9QC_000138 [Oceanicoccus sp.]|jgi:hypothetical protein
MRHQILRSNAQFNDETDLINLVEEEGFQEWLLIKATNDGLTLYNREANDQPFDWSETDQQIKVSVQQFCSTVHTWIIEAFNEIFQSKPEYRSLELDHFDVNFLPYIDASDHEPAPYTFDHWHRDSYKEGVFMHFTIGTSQCFTEVIPVNVQANEAEEVDGEWLFHERINSQVSNGQLEKQEVPHGYAIALTMKDVEMIHRRGAIQTNGSRIAVRVYFK